MSIWIELDRSKYFGASFDIVVNGTPAGLWPINFAPTPGAIRILNTAAVQYISWTDREGDCNDLLRHHPGRMRAPSVNVQSIRHDLS
jgi:hypothetical protein